MSIQSFNPATPFAASAPRMSANSPLFSGRTDKNPDQLDGQPAADRLETTTHADTPQSKPPRKKGLSCGCIAALLAPFAIGFPLIAGGVIVTGHKAIKEGPACIAMHQSGAIPDGKYDNGKAPIGTVMTQSGVATIMADGSVEDCVMGVRLATFHEGDGRVEVEDRILNKTVGYGDSDGKMYVNTKLLPDSLENYYEDLSNTPRDKDNNLQVGEVSESGQITDAFGRPLGQIKMFDGQVLSKQQRAAIGLVIVASADNHK